MTYCGQQKLPPCDVLLVLKFLGKVGITHYCDGSGGCCGADCFVYEHHDHASEILILTKKGSMTWYVNSLNYCHLRSLDV